MIQSEDETFRLLKRSTFKEIDDAMEELYKLPLGYEEYANKQKDILKKHCWTSSEYGTAFRLRAGK